LNKQIEITNAFAADDTHVEPDVLKTALADDGSAIYKIGRIYYKKKESMLKPLAGFAWARSKVM
jgi:hypothetical protein